jgi:hypothetical protein
MKIPVAAVFAISSVSVAAAFVARSPSSSKTTCSQLSLHDGNDHIDSHRNTWYGPVAAAAIAGLTLASQMAVADDTILATIGRTTDITPIVVQQGKAVSD